MATSSTDVAIEFRELTVDFPVGGGSVRALDDVTLDIGAGERVALLGSSGAGKSTLLDVVAGLVRPTEGRVHVLGRDLASLSGRSRRRHRSEVGVIRQHPGLPGSLRVVHNVNGGRLGSWSTPRALVSLAVPSGRDEVDTTLDRVGLPGLADRRTGDLSGGQQQRVAVARTIRQDPRLVLADEPVSAVDPRLSEDIVRLLYGLGRPDRFTARTVVLSLHDPDLARRFAERIIGIRAGRVSFDRPAHDVDDGALVELYQEE